MNPLFKVITVSGAIGVGKSTLIRKAALEIGVPVHADPSTVDFENLDKYVFFKEVVPEAEVAAFNAERTADTLMALQTAILRNFERLLVCLQELSAYPVTVVMERSPVDSLYVFLPLNRRLVSAEQYETLESSYKNIWDRFLPYVNTGRSFLLRCSQRTMLERVKDRGDALSEEYLVEVRAKYCDFDREHWRNVRIQPESRPDYCHRLFMNSIKMPPHKR